MNSLQVATVCASNMNRSMEAHALLARKGIDVESYGTGQNVRLPGPSLTQPNVYPFTTPYRDIYNELKNKDFDLYTRNGVLNMLDRNSKVKERPQQWTEAFGIEKKFDIIITVEERVFNAIIESFAENGNNTFETVHLVNIDVKDTHDEAVVGASIQLRLIQSLLSRGNSWSDEIDEIVDLFQSKEGREISHQILFY